jgi:hypothetical protein
VNAASLFFAIVGSATFVYTVIVSQKAHNALIELLPPQFQDPLNSRYAVDVYALSSSTPLALQADYIKSLIGFWFAVLCLALFCIFFFDQAWARWLPSVVFVVMTASTIKTWKKYKANCNRPLVARSPRVG